MAPQARRRIRLTEGTAGGEGTAGVHAGWTAGVHACWIAGVLACPPGGGTPPDQPPGRRRSPRTQRRRRVCLIGPECTGKTTLAERLSRELGVPWVPEYARAYAEARGNALTAADVEPIARGCMASFAAVDAPLVILDTDLLSTVVYARHYYGSCPSWIEEEARARRADLYLLLDTDLPWTADPARDTGGEAREDLFDAFRAALDELGVRWSIVSGEGEARVTTALAAIQGTAA